MPIRPIILIRFSYLQNSGLEKHFDDRAGLESYLFDTKRMEYRFWLFENFCLPSLLHQTDQDYFVVFLTSPELPTWCKARLEQLISPLNAMIAYEPSLPRTLAFQRIIERDFAFEEGQKMTIRLDDDDAIAIDWIAKLKEAARHSKALLRYNHCYSIYPSSGIILNLNSREEPIVGVHAKLPSSAGLAVVTDKQSEENSYSFPHFYASQDRPAISLPEPCSFLRVLHETNISHLQTNKQFYQLVRQNRDQEALKRALKDRFRVDLEALQARPDYQDPLIIPKAI